MFNKDNLINSCLRSIHSTFPWNFEAGARWTDVNLLALMCNKRECALNHGNLIFLKEINSWSHKKGKFTKNKSHGIEIQGVRVKTGAREISSWTQPIVCESENGVYGLVVIKYKGVPHLVLRFSLEPGYREKVEWSTAWINRDGDEGSNPEYWYDCFEKNNNSRIVFDKEFSEEGGRFYESTFRHLVYYISNIHIEIPDGYVLMSFEQVTRFMIHANYFSMELRSIISCWDFEWFND